jgi:hypothetical protein
MTGLFVVIATKTFTARDEPAFVITDMPTSELLAASPTATLGIEEPQAVATEVRDLASDTAPAVTPDITPDMALDVDDDMQDEAHKKSTAGAPQLQP